MGMAACIASRLCDFDPMALAQAGSSHLKDRRLRRVSAWRNWREERFEHQFQHELIGCRGIVDGMRAIVQIEYRSGLLTVREEIL